MSAASNSTEPALRFQPRTDPTTFEVLRHRLWQINDEQGQTLLNVSGSQIATEANDFNVAIADVKGNLIIVGPYIIIQMAPLSLMIQGVINNLGDDVAEGDMYLCNDPYYGAVHQNDVCVLAPVYWRSKRVGWTGSVIHEVDVGGAAPGSWCHEATEIFQEAPRYRYLRIVKGGRIQREVADTYLTNSRTPHMLELDLRAQIAAANVAQERLRALFDRYGQQTVEATMQDMLDYSEQLFLRKITSIPDGEWRGDCYLDHDGRTERICRYSVLLRKQGDMLTFDYRETDPQLMSFINCPAGGLYAATFVVLLAYLCGDIPWNSGLMRRVQILSKEGSLNHAKFPAPVSGALESIWDSVNAASAAVGKMLTCSQEQRESAMAVWQGSTQVYNVFGTNQYGQPYGSMLINSSLGGGGGRSFADGHDNAGAIMCPRFSCINVEQAEALYPFLYVYRKRAIDSGGPGTWRGGVSAESAITPYGTDQIAIRLTTSGSDHSHTAGLVGGYPGGASIGRVKRGALTLQDLQAGRFPECWSDMHGRDEFLPSKASFTLYPGDIFAAAPHGGGGYGDPLDRDPNLVRQDVRNGYVSRECAQSIYGVVLEGPSFTVNADATDSVKAAIRGTRAEKPARPHRKMTEFSNAPELANGLVQTKGHWHCRNCGYPLAPEAENPKAGCAIKARPLSAAGPWVALRYAGDNPRVHLIEFSCPCCARLLFVDERPKSDPPDVHDFNLRLQPETST
jgi:N-methylhydantoinase B